MSRRMSVAVVGIAVVGLLTGGASPLQGGSPVVTIAGTEWQTSSVAKMKVKYAAGTFAGQEAVFFGPNLEQGLPADHFLVHPSSAAVLYGTYAADAKGKITMTCYPGELVGVIADMVRDLAQSEGVDFQITSIVPTSQKSSGKVSKGVLKLKLTAKFELAGFANGEYYESKGTLTVTFVSH